MRLKLTREQKIAAKFLRGYVMIPDRMESYLSALESAETMRESLGSTTEALGRGGGGGDKMAVALVRIEEAEEGIRRMAETFGDQLAEIEAFISEVQRRDAMAGKALRLAYIKGLSAEEIADGGELGRSRKTVYDYLRRGLDIAFEMLSE